MGAWEAQARNCPLCGELLRRELVEDRSRPVCPACRFVLYQHPAAASAAIVARGRELLMVKRSIEPYRGYWGIPAGYQEYRETPVQAAIRETEEETGLNIEILGLWDLLYTLDDPRKRANLAVYLAQPIGGHERPGHDVLEVGWFSLDSMPEKIAFENNRRILEDLCRKYPEGAILPDIPR